MTQGRIWLVATWGSGVPGSPAIYNLLKDPQERERLRHYIEDTWVERPLYKVLGEDDLKKIRFIG